MSSIDIASTQPVSTPVVPLQASPDLSSTPGDGDQSGAQFNSTLQAPASPAVAPSALSQPVQSAQSPAQPINVQFPSGHVVSFPSAAHATQYSGSVWQQLKSTTAGAWDALLNQDTKEGSLLDDEHFGKFIGHIGNTWAALNTPVGDFGGHEGRTQDLVTRGMTMGMGTADVERSLQNPAAVSPTRAGLGTMLTSSWAGKNASAAKTATDLFTTPLGIVTFGVGGMLTRLAAREGALLVELNKSLDILEVQKTANAAPEVLQGAVNDVRMVRNSYEQAAMLHRSLKVVETSAASGFGGAGAQQAAEGYEQYRNAKTPQAKAAAANQFLQGTGQAILGGTAMAHGAVSNPADNLARVDKALGVPVPKADIYSGESNPSVESTTAVTTPVKPEAPKVESHPANVAPEAKSEQWQPPVGLEKGIPHSDPVETEIP